MDGLEQTRRQQILDAALRVFAREGYHKASIRQIALEAGLKSPPLLYWYFKDKNELFESVLVELSPLLRHINDIAGSMDEPPGLVLPRIAQAYLDALKNPDFERLFQIFLLEVGHTPEIGVQLLRNGLLRLADWLTSYFQRQIELGNVRRHIPEVGAYAFLGLMGSYILGRDILLSGSENLPDAEVYVWGALEFFLDGLVDHPGEPAAVLTPPSSNSPNGQQGGKE